MCWTSQCPSCTTSTTPGRIRPGQASCTLVLFNNLIHICTYMYVCVCEYPHIGFMQWKVKKMKASAIEHPFFGVAEMVEQSVEGAIILRSDKVLFQNRIHKNVPSACYFNFKLIDTELKGITFQTYNKCFRLKRQFQKRY